MDAKRQGEIALKLVKYQMRKEGIRFSNDHTRELGSLAANIGVSLADLKEFMRPLAQEILDEALRIP